MSSIALPSQSNNCNNNEHLTPLKAKLLEAALMFNRSVVSAGLVQQWAVEYTRLTQINKDRNCVARVRN